MTEPVGRSIQLRCHHCSQWIGEASTPLTFAGMFRRLEDRNLVPGPRETYRCKSCGWITVFRPALAAAIQPNGRNEILRHKLGLDAA